MAEDRGGVVVTEEMLDSAAFTGNLESLTVWAKEGVRVTSAGPLCGAAESGVPAVARLLVRQMGVDVNQASTSDGSTPLILAAVQGNLAMMRCLVELGAEVSAVDNEGDTALLMSAAVGHYSAVQYLLEEANANMDDVNNNGESAWDTLIDRLEEIDDENHEDLALAGLLRVLVLRGGPPPALVALLSPEPARVVQEGARLRTRLPAYLAHRRAYLDSRCPRISVLPGVLRALMYTFEGPATTEELWATGLGTAP
jgi:hypothetical protein